MIPLAPPPPVAGGEETSAWEEVGALYAYSDSAGGVEVCSATLLSPRAALTAAHCVEKVESWAAGGFRVYFLQGPSVDAFTRVTELSSITGHPDWNPRTVTWDIGLATLREPVDTLPAALPATAMDDTWLGRPVTLVGWGNVDLEENGSGVKRAGASVVSAVADDQFQTTGGPASSCPGDSGGAVFDDASGAIVGVVSWGTVDASAEHPCGTVQGHARVDAATDWIAEQLAAIDDDGDTATGDTATPDTGDEVAGPVEHAPGDDAPGAGCGCATAGGVWPGAGVLGLAAARRRAPGSRRPRTPRRA